MHVTILGDNLERSVCEDHTVTWQPGKGQNVIRECRVIRELEVTLNIGTLECLETRFLKGGGAVGERGVSLLRQNC